MATVPAALAVMATAGLAHPEHAHRAGAERLCSLVDAVVSSIGLMFGVLCWRTRSLTLVMFVHGWTDLVPNHTDFVQAWSL